MAESGTTAGLAVRGLAAIAVAGLAAGALSVFLAGEGRSGSAAPGAVVVFDLALVLCHGAGGAAAGWLLAGTFGRPGAAGWGLALLGGAVATLLAGLLGGAAATLLEELAGLGSRLQSLINIGMGALTLPMAAADRPWVAAAWASGIAALHLLARAARRGG